MIIIMNLRKFKGSLPLLLIIVTAAFVRLATLGKLMVFTPDEEYILYITQTLVKHLHIIWIGVSALGFDFYMGPLLEYFLVPFIRFSHGDPMIWGVITSLLGVATTYLVYKIGSINFNKKTGMIAAILYATSSLIVFY